jgi:predicted nuclease with RNAse H fold
LIKHSPNVISSLFLLSNVLSVGIDLAGSPQRDTGFCVMDEVMRCRTAVLHTDREIVEAVLEAAPSVVSIDAPLFLPRGRESLERKGPPHLRECDRELLRMKIRFFPISLGPMRSLTERGIGLRAVLERKGLVVIESFPGAIQDMLGMPRKQAGLEKLEAALREYGLALPRRKGGLTGDELDAATSALVGLMYLRGEYRAIGDPDEGLMILPKTKGQARSSASRRFLT